MSRDVFFYMHRDSALEWFPLRTEAALADVEGLRSYDANLEVAVAAGAPRKVQKASVVAPVARAAAKPVFAIELRWPWERTEAEYHHVAFAMRERTLLNSERRVVHRRTRRVIAQRL